jgi:putative SOS response-associated peptidase YedK
MPVILPPADYDHWLNPGIQDREDLQPLLRPCGEELRLTPVSTLVNSPRNESAECIEPVERQGELF